MNRRSILRLIGLSPAAPMAAKVALDTEVARLAGLQAGAGPFQYSGGGAPASSSDGGGYERSQVAAAEYVRAIGVPDFVRDTLMRQSQYVSFLDPDLAAKRSWSMSVKILTQRQRNYERAVEAVFYQSRHAVARTAFRKFTGWDWPF